MNGGGGGAFIYCKSEPTRQEKMENSDTGSPYWTMPEF